MFRLVFEDKWPKREELEGLRARWEKFVFRLKFTDSLAIFILEMLFVFLIAVYISRKVELETDSFYWVLSSIYQGLFAIISLAGIFIIFRIELFDRWIERWDQDIRVRIDKQFSEGSSTREFFKEELLEKRRMEDFVRELSNEIGDKDMTMMRKAVLINNSRYVREKGLRLFKLPLLHGLLVISASILFLSLFSSANIEVKDITVFTLSILSVFVGVKLLYVIKIVLYSEEEQKSNSIVLKNWIQLKLNPPEGG